MDASVTHFRWTSTEFQGNVNHVKCFIKTSPDGRFNNSDTLMR